MLATLSAVLLAAAPVKVALPGFTVVGMDQGMAAAWADRFVTLMEEDPDFKPISSKDIAQVLGLERQKQLLGCSEGETSCLAELAGALGVDAILSGTIAQSGTSITATLRVLKANDGSLLASATSRVKDQEALLDWLDAQARELSAKLRVAFKLPARGGSAEASASPTTVSAAPKASGGGGSIVRWVPAIVGGGAAIAGVALFVVSKGNAQQLRSGMVELKDIDSTASSGKTFESAGVGLMIGGGVAIAASVVWVLLAPGSSAKAGLMVTPEGGVATVGGTF
jgi:hypothetical protein